MYYFRVIVRLRQFLGRALRLRHARGPSAAATSNEHKNSLYEILPVCRFTLWHLTLFAEYNLFKPTISIRNCIYMNFPINLTQF